MLGEEVRKIRKRAGLNQFDFGRRIGLSLTGVSSIETGHSNPSIEILKAISREFDVPVDALLSLTEGRVDGELDARMPAEKNINGKDITRLIGIVESQQETIAKLVEKITK